MSQYATLDDLEELANEQIADLPKDKREAALTNASGEVDSYIGQRYKLPLIAPFDPSIVSKTIDIAVWDLMSRFVGFNPEAPGDVAIYRRYQDAIKFLQDVRDRKNAPASITDSGTVSNGQPVQSGAISGAPMVISSTSRGFSSRNYPDSDGLPFVGD